MKNWKTTVGGLAAGIASIAGGVSLIIAGEYEKGVIAVVGGAAMIWTGFHAKDAA